MPTSDTPDPAEIQEPASILDDPSAYRAKRLAEQRELLREFGPIPTAEKLARPLLIGVRMFHDLGELAESFGISYEPELEGHARRLADSIAGAADLVALKAEACTVGDVGRAHPVYDAVRSILEHIGRVHAVRTQLADTAMYECDADLGQ